MPDSITHAPDSGVEYMAPVSGAGFWSVCRWLYTYNTEDKLLFCFHNNAT